MTDPTASRHFGMPVPRAVAEHDPALLAHWTGSGDEDQSATDLVEAHLRINHAYFGAVDKSLSGFVVLDDEDDDYTLVDLRGSGQVWWQDHETRELELRWDSFEEWQRFRDQLEEAEADPNDESDERDLLEAYGLPAERRPETPAPTTAELADRYQWLMWFLAQPTLNHGRPMQRPEDFVSHAAWNLRSVFPNAGLQRVSFESELPVLAADPHLAVYWLLHTAILGQDAERQRVLAALDGTEQPELVEAFRAVFGPLGLDGDVPIVPHFRVRRADLLQICADGKDEQVRATLRAMVIAPEDRSIERSSQVVDGLRSGLLDDAETAAILADTVSAGASIVRAELDRRAGNDSSLHADIALREIIDSADEGWTSRFWGVASVYTLSDDLALLSEAAELVLGKDPYVRFGFDLVDAIHACGDEDAVLSNAELLRRRPLATATSELIEALDSKPIGTVAALAEAEGKEVADVLAQRILCRGDLDEPHADAVAVAWAVTRTLAGSHPDRAELAARGIELLPLEILAETVATLGGAIASPDDPLVPVLLRLLDQTPEPDPGDFRTELPVRAAKSAIFKALFPVAHDPAVFDALMQLTALPAPGSTVEKLWEQLFSPFEEDTYLLHRLTDGQAERAAKAMIRTVLEHPARGARNAAGIQLYWFDHTGAQDFVIAALTEYGGRYADSDRCESPALGHDRTEDSQLGFVVDNLYAAVTAMGTPDSRAALIDRLWTERRSFWRMGNAVKEIHSPEVHAAILERLRATGSHLAAAHYAFALNDHVKEGRAKIALLAEISTWAVPEEPALRRQFKYALLVGVEAALAAKEFALVRAGHALAEEISEEPAEPHARLEGGRSWTSPLTAAEHRGALAAALSGEADAARRRVLEAGETARATSEPRRISDGELALLVGCEIERRILADEDTGEVWCVDTEGETHRFDGYNAAELPFGVEPLGLGLTPAFLEGVTERTEHAVLWSKDAAEVLDLARYGDRITYQWGGNCERLEARGLVFDGPEAAANAFSRIKAYAMATKYTGHHPWYVPGKGAVRRRLHKAGADTLAIMAFEPAKFEVDEAIAQESESRELAAQRDDGYALHLIEWSTLESHRLREELTVAQWMNARILLPGQSPDWQFLSLLEIADYLAAHGFTERCPGLASLRVEFGDGVSEAEIAAFEAGREQPVPEPLRRLWRKIGRASWSLQGRRMRLLSPAEALAARPLARETGAALLARMPPHQAEKLEPAFTAFDVLIAGPDGKPDTVFTPVPYSEEDGRVFIHLGAAPDPAGLWWEKSLSWMFAAGILTEFTTAVTKAAPETAMLFGGQRLGPGLTRRRFATDSEKFWEVWTDPSLDVVATRHGKAGAPGITESKRYGDPAKAAEKAAKLIAAKEKQGYRETTG